MTWSVSAKHTIFVRITVTDLSEASLCAGAADANVGHAKQRITVAIAAGGFAMKAGRANRVTVLANAVPFQPSSLPSPAS